MSEGRSGPREVWHELKRRKVFHVVGAYAATAFVILQLTDLVVDPLGLPGWVQTLVIFVTAVGFPLALVLAWAFEVTPEGVRPGRPVPGLGASTSVAAVAGAGVALVALAGGAWWLATGGWTGDGETSPSSVAVLPFQALGNGDAAVIGDGLTEDVILHLSRVEGLKVISRTSVERYGSGATGSRATAQQIARELDVGTLLEGSVRRSGDRVRVVVQLVDARTDGHLWAESYDRRVEDVFALQGEIARRIAGALRTRLSSRDEERLRRRRQPANLEAYEAYLEGRRLWDERTPGSLRRALDRFERATVLDSGYARAYAGIAETWAVLPAYVERDREEADRLGLRAALRAISLDPDLAEAWVAMGRYSDDPVTREMAIRRGLRLRPGYAHARQALAWALLPQGRLAEAVRELRRARDLDPHSLIINLNMGEFLMWNGRPAEAEPHFRRLLELRPEHHLALQGLGRTALARGDTTAGLEWLEEALEAAPARVDQARALLAHARAVAGRTAAARETLARLEEDYRAGRAAAGPIGYVHLGLGEHDRAAEWFRRAVREGDEFLLSTVPLNTDPAFEPLRAAGRWRDLVEMQGRRPAERLRERGEERSPQQVGTLP